MATQWSASLQRLIERALEKSQALGVYGLVSVPCLAIALAEDDGIAGNVLHRFGLTADILQQAVLKLYQFEQQPPSGRSQKTKLSVNAIQCLQLAAQLAIELRHSEVTPAHLLYVFLRTDEGERIFVRALFSSGNGASPNERLEQMLEALVDALKADGAENAGYSNAEQPMQQQQLPKQIAQFADDLTQLAREGKLAPVIGRQAEIRRAIEILGRESKNNPCLVGEPGVGKTAIAEGVAAEIAAGRVPKSLQGKMLLRLNVTSMLAGTRYRGDFEERMKSLLDALLSMKNAIVFIDEIHTIVGAGAAGESSLDAANMLKQSLARGEFGVIGATTLREYRKYIEKDAALERRFQPVMVEPPSVEDTIEILKGRKEKLEEHHGISIADEAIVAAARLADRYIADRFQPDKSIDVIDEAASGLAIDNAGGELTAEHVAEKVGRMTGIKVDKLGEDEMTRLAAMESELHKRVVGQEVAVSAVARAIRRARAGLKNPRAPIGSFLFVGPTGVGKTEVARALQDFLFHDESGLIRLDMSEYMEKHSVSKLIGSPPGYVGYDEAGQLTEKVRRRPYAVVLFDEIEKAHPDVFNILLQIMDDGRLTDAHGRTVSFKNTVIIMTSNVGSDKLSKRSLGFATEGLRQGLVSTVMSDIRLAFSPEFINRLDEIVAFSQLSQDEIRQVVDLVLADLKGRLSTSHNISIEITDAAKEVLVANGYDVCYGARPMKRAVQRLLEDPLSEGITSQRYRDGSVVVIDTADSIKLTFAVKAEAQPQ